MPIVSYPIGGTVSHADNLLLWAVELGHLGTVTCLVEQHKADVHTTDNYGLCLAAERGCLEIIDYLLQCGAEPAANDWFCLKIAAEYGKLSCVERLLKVPSAQVAVDGQYCIKWAARNGHTAVVSRLLSHPDCNPAVDDSYALTWAARYGHVDTVRVLLEQDGRVDIHSADDAPLRRAAEFGHLETLELLLCHGAYPEADDDYAIKWASRNGHEFVVGKLLSMFSVDPTTDFNYALKWSALKMKERVVQLLANDHRFTLDDIQSSLVWVLREATPDHEAVLRIMSIAIEERMKDVF
ncbi:ankyrin repeat-containing domain protein [Chytriomyces sp. MP71]|nr:ankyrin repeat-containing domain protein [Chytriomyces sp. MP71]